MNRVYTAVTRRDNGFWIGWIEEVPGVNCQERTHGQLLESLKATLKEAWNLIGEMLCPLREWIFVKSR